MGWDYSDRRGRAPRAFGRAVLSCAVLAVASAALVTGRAPRGPEQQGAALRTVPVATAAQLRDALAAARPGDHVVVAAGEYEGTFDIRASGTAERPVVVRSAAAGQAVFVRQTRLDIAGAAWVVIQHNLFEGCDGDMEIISVKATDVTVRHNTIDGSQGALTARHGHRARFIGNTILGRGGRLMLRRESPAINRAHGGYSAVVTDLEGQPRRAPRDIGADEYSTAPIRCPRLTPREVGPGATDRRDCPLAIQEERRR